MYLILFFKMLCLFSIGNGPIIYYVKEQISTNEEVGFKLSLFPHYQPNLSAKKGKRGYLIGNFKTTIGLKINYN